MSKEYKEYARTDNDRENWHMMWVVEVDGGEAKNWGFSRREIKTMEFMYFIIEKYGIPIASEGSGVPGQAFADEPWISKVRDYKTQSGIQYEITIQQSGGLDI